MQAPRKQHYNFAYFTLPLLALSNTNETLKKLDRNDRVSYLRMLWNGLGSKTGEHLPDKGLNCYKQKLDSSKTLFVIELPAPQIQPEAFFVGLVFDVESGFFSSKVTNPRCFTLELSKDIPSQTVVYVVGELVPGQSFPNFDHRNHGSIIKNDGESFVYAIQDAIVGRKTSEVWNIEKINNDRIRHQNGNEFSNSTGEDELEIIWNKWTNHPISEQAKELCFQQTQPFADRLQDLALRCIKSGLLSDQQKQIPEWVGEGLGKLSRGAYMIGLEYPEFAKDTSNFSETKVFRLLQEAAKQVQGLYSLFTMSLSNAEEISLNAAREERSNCAQLMLNAMVGCYLVGAELSPKTGGDIFQVLNKLESAVLSNYEYQSRRDNRENLKRTDQQLIADLRYPNRREMAVQALIEKGESTVQIVRPLLKDGNSEVRIAALKILSEIEKKNL